MNKNSKLILFSVILLVLFYIIISIILSLPLNKKTYNGTVFLGSSTKVKINNNNISITNEDVEINKTDVKIYFKEKFIDGYILSNKGVSSGVENIYSAYNKKDELLLNESVLVAYTNDIPIKIKEMTKIRSNNLNEITDKIKNINVEIPSTAILDYYTINILDIDNDGINERLYSVGFKEKEKSYKSYVFMEKGGKYILIDKQTSKYDGIDHEKLSFVYLIDFNNDDNYEFVIRRVMTEYGPDYYELYNFDGNEFVEIGGE